MILVSEWYEAKSILFSWSLWGQLWTLCVAIKLFTMIIVNSDQSQESEQLTCGLLVIQAAAYGRGRLVGAGVGPDEGGRGGEGRWGLHLGWGFLIWNKTFIRTIIIIIISTRENQSHGETNLKYIDWHRRGQTSGYHGIRLELECFKTPNILQCGQNDFRFTMDQF